MLKISQHIQESNSGLVGPNEKDAMVIRPSIFTALHDW